MPSEMIFLRNALNARNVSYIDASDDEQKSFPFMNLTIYRTKFIWKDHFFSVISGYGTFGGDKGLLELMVDSNEPFGSLRAVDVIKIMDEV